MAEEVLSDELSRLRAENWRLKHELAEERERYQCAMDNDLVGFLVASFELNRFLDANQRYCDFLGFEREELLASDPYRFWLDTTFPDDRPLELKQLELIVEGSISSYVLKKRFVRKTGELRWGQLSYGAVRDPRGRVRYGVMVCTDIHEQQSALEARQKLQESLLQAQKLETVGRLVGGVAHDFNNRLLVIMGHADILKRSVTDAKLAAHAEVVVSSARRAADLTRQLLAYSRRQVLKPRAVDLNVLVEATREVLDRLFGDHIELVTVLGARFPMLADAGQIEQVLMNLMLNARDAMPEGGRLVLETFDVELSEPGVIDGLGPGAYVGFTVSDTGVGIPDSERSRIFEPFYTTKQPGQGTGLGLSSVEGIVRQSGGGIAVSSAEGRGSSFTVYLPRAEVEVEEASTSRDDVRVTEHLPCLPELETVLVVDDEADVRGLLVEVLRLGGYRVLEAKDGAEALRLASAHPDPIGLLVTDIVMPGISGKELADTLRARSASLKVLFMSGYAERHTLRELQQNEQFIPKPFLPEELFRHVNDFLHDSPRHSEPSAL
jgi:two-component system cell cycle sensor histidine kinase/response regulator CckA